MFFYLLAHRAEGKTSFEIAEALKWHAPNTRRILESMGMRLPLTHRPWRLKKHEGCPARWTLEERVRRSRGAEE